MGCRVNVMLAVASMVLLPACGSEEPAAGDNDGAKFAKIRAELEELAQAEHVPGMAFAIVLDGKVAYSDAVGVRSSETGEPLTSDMVMPTGSIAVKFLVAAAVMRLHQQGKLSLDAPVTTVLPWFSPPTGSEGVTLQQGFTMRTGISSPLRTECTDPTLKGVLASQTTYAPPGDVWVYSSVGFTLGALAIEEVTSTSFEQVITQELLDPMGLASATFDASEAMAGEHSAVHLTDAVGNGEAFELDNLPHCKPGVDCSVCEEFRANAGLYLSANQLGRIVEVAVSNQAPLTSDLLDGMQERAGATGWGDGYQYGFGLASFEFGGMRAFFGGTQYAGTTGFMSWIPEAGMGVVLIANSQPKDALFHPTLNRQIVTMMRHFVDLPDPDFSTPPSTWEKYTGKYVGPVAAAPYEVTLTDGALAITNPLWSDPAPVEMKQGGAWAWASGDAFHFTDPAIPGERYVTFFSGAGDGSTMQYMVSEGPWLLAKRAQ